MQQATDSNNVHESFAQLCGAIRDNLSWMPTISMVSTHFLIDGNHIGANNNAKKENINIALFLLDMQASMTPDLVSHRCMLHYPRSAVLEIEGFLGIDEEANVVSTLKAAAAAGGTVLVVESVRKGRRDFLWKNNIRV
jgi:hypothetical protein